MDLKYCFAVSKVIWCRLCVLFFSNLVIFDVFVVLIRIHFAKFQLLASLLGLLAKIKV